MPEVRILVALAVVVLAGEISQAEDKEETPKLAAALSAEVDGKLLAGFPIQFKLTVANRGKLPICYWCGGPGSYPNASPFAAIVADRRGVERILPLHNGQYIIGSGQGHKIDSEQTLPAVCDPVEAGVYKLTIEGKSRGYYPAGGKRVEDWPAMSSEELVIAVVNNPTKLAAAERDLLARAKDDPFSRHVAEVYGIDPIVKKLLNQLLNDDPKVASRALGHLQCVRRLPACGDAMLEEAAAKHSRAQNGEPDKNLLGGILLIARNTHTGHSVNAIVTIARSDADLHTRRWAVRELASLSGERAEQALLELAGEKDSPIYWECVAGLSHRKNRAALDPLLQLTMDESPDWRSYALLSLTELRDVPEARSALLSALKDDDEDVRGCAKRALEWQTPDLGIWPWR